MDEKFNYNDKNTQKENIGLYNDTFKYLCLRYPPIYK